MDINDLTIGQAKKLAALFGSQSQSPSSPHIGKKCIIRSYASGVHFGELVTQNGRQVELKNARRLWRWDVTAHGISLSEVALHGPDGAGSKICSTLPEMSILDALEIIPCTETAASVIESARVFIHESV